MAKEFQTETQIQIQIQSLSLGRYHADANTSRRISERKLTSKI